MMRGIWILFAAVMLAGCEARGGDDAARSAPAAAVDSLAVRETATPDSASRDTAAYAVRLHEARRGTVDSITVTHGGRAVQTLRPVENHVPPEIEIERISRIDLDFDGHADLGFVTELAMANSSSEYWRMDPASGRFVAAGVHPTLRPDSAARELTSFERGGHAGRLWTASRWRWTGGALAEVRREEQDLTAEGDRYLRIVRERRDGTLTETARDTLDDAGVRAGPSWMEP